MSPELKRKLEELTNGRVSSSPSTKLKRLMSDFSKYSERVQNADSDRAEIISQMSTDNENSLKAAKEYQEMLDGKRPFDIKESALSKEEYEQQGPHTQVIGSPDGTEKTIKIDYDSYKLFWDLEHQGAARKETEEKLAQVQERIAHYPTVLNGVLKFFDVGTRIARSMLTNTAARIEKLMGGIDDESIDVSNESSLEEYKKLLTEQVEKGQLDKDSMEKLLQYMDETGDEDLTRFAKDRLPELFGNAFEARA